MVEKADREVMRYTHEQGLARRRVRVEDVFHPSTLER